MNKKTTLTGGRSGEIYRQGKRVLRPAKPWTADVQRFLRFLCDNGANFVPVPFGVNENNEEMLSYLPGEVYNYPLPAVMLTDKMIISAARLLRAFHDQGAAYLSLLTGTEPWMLPRPPGAVEVMCHGDFAPYNITVITGASLAADTSTKLRRARLFLDAYGLNRNERGAFIRVLTARLQALIAFMQTEAQKGNETFQQHIAAGHLALYQNDLSWLNRIESFGAWLAGS